MCIKKYFPSNCFYFLMLLDIFPLQSNTWSSYTAPAISSTAVAITFGRGPSCTGRGLCQVEEPGTFTAGAGEVWGQMSVDANGALQMSISKSGISVKEQETQFKNGVFKIIDAYALPTDLSSQMGFSQSLTISPGDYAVQEDATHYTIAF